MAYPIPTRVSKKIVNAFAEKVAEDFGLEPGGALEPVLERLGGRLSYGRAPIAANSRPESMIVRGPRDFTIFVPGTTTLERDRFTIAHELGHFYLHYPKVAQVAPGEIMIATRWVDENDPEQMRAEWEANWFAAGFLMPSKSFRSVYEEEEGNMQFVAARFIVSVQAAEIRVSSIGLR